MENKYLYKLLNNVIINDETGCWEWQGATLRGGYGNLRVDGKNCQTHRLSYEFYVGDIPKGMLVCHHCDNPSCCNPEHLFLGTYLDNAKDRNNKDRQAKGETCAQSKLTEQDVLKIRALWDAGNISMRKIAKRYNMAYSQINSILHRKTWVHI